jgi:hypothetical protein
MQNLQLLSDIHHSINCSLITFAFNSSDQIIYVFTKDWLVHAVSVVSGEKIIVTSLLGQADFAPEVDDGIVAVQYVAELECVSLATRQVKHAQIGISLDFVLAGFPCYHQYC